jgi:hypothetical protein
MNEKNGSSSFLDLLEQMKSYLGTARKMGGEIAERQKTLTEQHAEKDRHPRDDQDDER